MVEQKYSLGRQSFETIIEEDRVYVDKTKLIYDLINRYPMVFLARPRRFGKSLLLSTIKAFFEGKKDLFKNYEIYNLEHDWKIHPVFQLDLSGISSFEVSALRTVLSEQLNIWEKQYNIQVEDKSNLSLRFRTLIREAHISTGEKVVILIDEYDNPLINTLSPEKHDIHENNLDLLKTVYSNLKTMDPHIRFTLMTGVSRFSRTSIFSGPNNLIDITFSDRYSSICGFTEDEIRQFLWSGVELLGKKIKKDPEEALSELKAEYDGYHFSEESEDIYNPFSLLHALDNRKISDYWLVSGTPGFLVEKLKESKISFSKVFDDEASEQGLAAIDTAFSSPVALLYQTGYVTIKGYNSETRKYKLGIPNREIERNLFPALLGAFTATDEQYARDLASEMGECLRKGEPEEFILRLKSFFSADPYNIIRDISELYFEHSMYLIFRSIPVTVEAESPTSYGRRDLVVKTEGYIYIFELKLDGDASAALDQIKNKEYTLPHKYDGKKIYKIAIIFSSKTRNVADWKIEEDV